MADATWLSLTPEPERELPAIVASLRAGGAPDPTAVARERARVEEVVLRGTEDDWLAYVGEALRLALEAPDDRSGRRSVALEVLANHHRLLLGLPGDAADRTEAERARLERALAPPPNPNGGR